MNSRRRGWRWKPAGPARGRCFSLTAAASRTIFLIIRF